MLHTMPMSRQSEEQTDSIFRRMAPSWLNDNVMGVVSTLKLGGGLVSFLSSGLGSGGASNFNPWRLIGSFGFMGIQGLGTAYKEQPVTPEQRAELDSLSPTHYALRKISYAFDPKHHIVESNGLLTIANGSLLIPSYLHEGDKGFYVDLIYAATNAVSGGAMLFAKDPKDAWQISSAVQLLGTPIQFYSIAKLMESSSANAVWKGKTMMGSAILFTAANLTGLLIGHNKYEDMPKNQIAAEEVMIEKPAPLAPMRAGG